jgi:hypothetical protein
MDETVLERINGADAVIEWFGRWPSFHDAEVIEFRLLRDGLSRLAVHAWRTLPEVDADGYYKLDKHAVITFLISNIKDLELAGEDFNRQNVLRGLTLENADGRIKIQLWPSYGIGGYIVAGIVTVEMAPGEPSARRQK